MSDARRRRGLVAAIAAVALLAAGVLVFVLATGGETRDDRERARETPAADARDARRDAAPPAVAEAAAPETPRDAGRRAIVEILLVPVATPARPDGQPTVAPKAGQTHTVSGLITENDAPVDKAIVWFIAGLNVGARAFTNEKGRFTIPALYPGAGVFVVGTPSGRRATRDLVLFRGNVNVTFRLDFGPPGTISGTVVDAFGEAIAGARVEVDANAVFANADGAFVLERVTPGDGVILQLSANRYESRRQLLQMRPGQTLELHREACLLRRSEPIRIAFGPWPRESPAPTLAFLPPDGPRQRSDVWGSGVAFDRIAASNSSAGGENELVIEGVPVGPPFQARAFADVGLAAPTTIAIPYTAGETAKAPPARVAFEWKWPVSAIVLADGKPLGGAHVTIESENIADATEAFLMRCGGLNRLPVPVLPCARKVAVTDPTGFFRVETADVYRPAALTIETDGFERVTRALPAIGSADFGGIELKPGRSTPGAARLAVDFANPATRAVRVTVNGEARPERELAAGAACEIDDVPAGRYRIVVRAGNAALLDQEIAVGADARVSVP